MRAFYFSNPQSRIQVLQAVGTSCVSEQILCKCPHLFFACSPDLLPSRVARGQPRGVHDANCVAESLSTSFGFYLNWMATLDTPQGSRNHEAVIGCIYLWGHTHWREKTNSATGQNAEPGHRRGPHIPFAFQWLISAFSTVNKPSHRNLCWTSNSGLN